MTPSLRILPAGDAALLIEVESLDRALALHAAIEAARLPGVLELVPAARTVLVRFRRGTTSGARLARQLRALTVDEAALGEGERIDLPVHYDGDDLDEVATLLGLSREALVERHLAATWRVAFVGFAPGFAYMPGDDPVLEVPRRSTPRTRIPAGAVAMAGRYSGVYPRESPGGWQLFGRTTVPMWDLDRDPPALLRPGGTVRFVRAERDTIEATAPVSSSAPHAAPTSSDGTIEVVRPGLQALVQDLGRAGNAHLGVSGAGAVDHRALRAVNRVVGNPSDAAVLEFVGGGAELLAHADQVVAFDGAVADVNIVTTAGVTVPVERGHAAILEPGDRLCLGAVTHGIRVYLGVRGGIAATPVLGSVSSDTLAGLGPAPLRAGDRIEVLESLGDVHAVGLAETALPTPPAPGDEVRLDVVLGPRTDWFSAEAVDTLTGQPWQVTAESNRVGLRLAGEEPLARSRTDELDSEGAVTGSIQVPPSGQPVLFLADHPLTGGYPIIGVVASHHLDALGQLPPGVDIRFHVIAPFSAGDDPHTPTVQGSASA